MFAITEFCYNHVNLRSKMTNLTLKCVRYNRVFVITEFYYFTVRSEHVLGKSSTYNCKQKYNGSILEQCFFWKQSYCFSLSLSVNTFWGKPDQWTNIFILALYLFFLFHSYILLQLKPLNVITGKLNQPLSVINLNVP